MIRVILSATLALFAVLFSACSSLNGNDSAKRWLETPELNKVSVTDNFWTPKIERNRMVTIPYAFTKCEETGRIDNFAIAGKLKEGSFKGERYNDSDLFKIIEGACYSLIEYPDAILEAYVDSLVYIIASSQEDDGYLYTTRTIDSVNMAPGAGRERWIDERVSHELYNAGHMYEAAVAHYLATGRKTFLDVAVKNADLVEKEFGWGKREIAPGHQEIEIGLIKLWRVTGEKRFLDLAQFFLEVRGRQGDYVRHPVGTRFEVYNDSVYLQMHLPVLEQKSAVGHAVRGAYMYSAMADLAEATGDNRWLEASQTIWTDVVSKKIYITGGIGSKEFGEAFGGDYELPNMSAYTETCASVANVFWNFRLYRATGDGSYLDVLERTLYNGLISGIGQDGCSFFYPNPLESDGRFRRSEWFECSCCPGNIARFMPLIPQYIYATDDDALRINLFISSDAALKISGRDISIRQETNYPWDGKVTIHLTPENKPVRFKLMIRLPGWTGEAPIAGNLYRYVTPENGNVIIKLNGKEVDYSVIKGFVVIERTWYKDDQIEYILPLKPRFITARREVKADSNRIALGLGPLVYCLEEVDNGRVRNILVDQTESVDMVFNPEISGGINVLYFNALDNSNRNISLRAVPYFTWANRGVGEMLVWMKTK